jgi:hypothetical protein
MTASFLRCSGLGRRLCRVGFCDLFRFERARNRLRSRLRVRSRNLFHESLRNLSGDGPSE